MIESFLFAVLGFLVAAGLAMAFAPTLWRRAERLERKRIEASLPLSKPEQEAAIDAVRAERAMSIRRLEIKLQALGQKNTQAMVESEALHQRLSQLGEASATSARLVEVTQHLAEQNIELRALSRLNDELEMTISTQKIDLVASEAEIERLNNGLNLLRTQRREADRLLQQRPVQDPKPVSEAGGETALIAQLQQRIADLTTTYSKRTRNTAAAEKSQQALREEISSLAAQMVQMVALREGPNSVIEKALAEAVRTVPGSATDNRPESLADRVRKLG